MDEKIAYRMPQNDVIVLKKSGEEQPFIPEKIVSAVEKSASRALLNLSNADKVKIVSRVVDEIEDRNLTKVKISDMHLFVEKALMSVSEDVAKEYKFYRNYKNDFAEAFDSIRRADNAMRFRADKENANRDGQLVSTKRTLLADATNKALYERFFLTKEERIAISIGYIYTHDMAARRDTMNCCIFDVASVLKGGFTSANMWYNEPSSLPKAFSVIGDIVLSAASQQYGGFTLPSVDSLLAPYAEKSYNKLKKKYSGMGVQKDLIEQYVMADLKEMFEDGFQGWEYKFNTVASSRGDYPFITITFGLGTSLFEKMATMAVLTVRKNGQGKKDAKRPVLFPKLVFLYDKNLHGDGKELEDLFFEGVECSKKTMYPDWLSLTGKGYICDIYKKYGLVIHPMGCRAFLSPWYKKGGIRPADEFDEPVFEGRGNIGVISLHLPLIYQKSVEEGTDFFEEVEFYMNMARQIHLRTWDYLGEMEASSNPLAYCEGGFLNGHLSPDEKIAPVLRSFTASFGVTALNELQELYNRHSLVEDNSFALKTMEFINQLKNRFIEEDERLYAIYGTPAENLCGLQVRQFRQQHGIIKGVSDREYVSNSFHCHVTEDITPTQKQDREYDFWEYFNGGKIQYVKYPIDYNTDAVITLLRRAMEMGYYEGINMSLSFCNDCGASGAEIEKSDTCPVCGSKMLTKIDRMNGYLAFSQVTEKTATGYRSYSRLANHKQTEIEERKSM